MFTRQKLADSLAAVPAHGEFNLFALLRPVLFGVDKEPRENAVVHHGVKLDGQAEPVVADTIVKDYVANHSPSVGTLPAKTNRKQRMRILCGKFSKSENRAEY